LAPCNDAITINKQSDSKLHEEVFKIAKYFQEELNYDRIPYSQLGMIPKKDTALLFTEEALDVYKTMPMHTVYTELVILKKLNSQRLKIAGHLNGYGFIRFFVIEETLKNIGMI